MIAAGNNAKRTLSLVFVATLQRCFLAIFEHVGAVFCVRLLGIANVDFALYWHTNDAKHRLVILNQRDIDSEFAITINELLSAIQRVYQPITLPGCTLSEGGP